MKKINIALMILSGFALIGLTGCGGGGDADPAPVVNNPETPVTDCSGFAGTYRGNADIPNDENTTIQQDAEFAIANNCVINSELIGLISTTGSGHASNLTSKKFNYNIKWAIGPTENGNCSYASGSLICDGSRDTGGVTRYQLSK